MTIEDLLRILNLPETSSQNFQKVNMCWFKIGHWSVEALKMVIVKSVFFEKDCCSTDTEASEYGFPYTMITFTSKIEIGSRKSLNKSEWQHLGIL